MKPDRVTLRQIRMPLLERAEDPARAREIQRAAATSLQGAFSRGLAATGFERFKTEGAYLLEPCP